MADKVDTLPIGTEVTWHYRSAIGHGTVEGIAEEGDTSATTKYKIRQHDHHEGEPDIVEHFGSALTRAESAEKSAPAASNRINFYAPFSKVETTSDGGREVWGFASLEVKDKTGEIADFERTVQAFDKWSTEIEKATQGKSKGNIRYMHSADAVGKMIDWKPGEKELEDGSTAKGVYIGVKVPAYETRTVGQIDDGILTGFSIGGNYVDRWWDEAQKAYRYAPELAETSLVDNPAVPGANFDLIRMQKGVMEVNESLLKASADNDKLHEEQEARAKKYGISAKDGGHLTPPKGKPTDPDDYGDPVNYAYPVDKTRVTAAVGYYNVDGNQSKGGYTDAEWSIVGKRIVDAANRLNGEGYEIKDGKILTPNTVKKAQKARWSELCKKAGIDGEPSYEDIRQMVQCAIEARDPLNELWICDTYPDYVIANDWRTDQYWKIEYTCDGDVVTLGQLTEVQQGSWEPKEATKSVENDPNLQTSPAPVVKADGADKDVDAKIAALKKELAELEAAQKKDDDEDAKKAHEALEILKSINGKLEKAGAAVSASRRKHLGHAIDHVNHALGNHDAVQDQAHIDMTDGKTPTDNGVDVGKLADAIISKLDLGKLQKSAPDVEKVLTQALESAGLAKAAEVATLTEQLAKAMEQIASLEGQVKAIGEQPQSGGAMTSVFPGLGGAVPWQATAEKAVLENLLQKTADPALKDALGRELATQALTAQLAGARKPTA